MRTQGDTEPLLKTVDFQIPVLPRASVAHKPQPVQRPNPQCGCWDLETWDCISACISFICFVLSIAFLIDNKTDNNFDTGRRFT